MCKQMMGQRAELERKLEADLERCLKNIRQNGKHECPGVRVDMEDIFIANREYFEQQGFFFEPVTKVENKHIRYYAWIRLGSGNGEMGRKFWSAICDAKETFNLVQRNTIFQALREVNGAPIHVNMSALTFENKSHFEQRGYIFEPESSMSSVRGQHFAWMKKRH